MYFFLIILFVSLAEIAVFIEVGKYIGTLNTIIVILLTALAGAVAVKIEGLRVWHNVSKEIKAFRLPTNSVIDAALVLVSGVLLITPGFLTDMLGLLLLLPLTRIFVRKILQKHFSKKIKRNFHIIDGKKH